MRVAMVCPYDLTIPGGVQQHAMHLARQLQSGGDDVLLVAPCSGRAATDDVAVVSVGGARGVHFNGSVAPVALHPAVWRRTREAIVGFGPDVVHVHEPMVPLVGPAAVFAAQGPVVATFHAYAQRRRLYRAARALTRRIAARIDVPLAVSRAARGHHARALGMDEARFTVVPNGVDVAAHRPPDGRRSSPTWSTRPQVLFVGRLEERKGLFVLLDAFVRLRRTHDAELTVVGDGPERQRATARLPAELRDDVHLLGRLTGDELAAVRQRADITVAPALGGESFGIVLLEAMAAESAVVASDLPGFRDVLDDGRVGRLVPAGDPDALAAALATDLDDPIARQARIDAARAHVAAYDWPAVAKRVRATYPVVDRNR
ncbi:MAG: glycosyltransferase family 4 protein [Nitriliruptoraceae bacterium]